MKTMEELITANDNEIFDLTGCLSLCDKYAYTAQQVMGMKYMDATNSNTSTLTLQFYYSDVEHELREQVILVDMLLYDVF